MSRLSFKEFSGGLPVTQTNSRNPRLPQQQAAPESVFSRIVKDIPGDIVETFKGVIESGRTGSENFTEAFTRPNLTVAQRGVSALAAPFSAAVNAGGEILKGGAKLLTTDEFEQKTQEALVKAGQSAMNSQVGMKLREFYDSLPEDQKYTLTNIIAPVGNVIGSGVVGGEFKAGADALKSSLKTSLKSTPRTATEAAEAVVKSANPIVENTAKTTGNSLVDTVKGLGTQFKDFARRTVNDAQDTAQQSKRLSSMPEPKATLIRNGADERIVNVVDQASPDEIKIYRELVDQAKLKEADPTPNTSQPKVIAGREFLKPVDYLISSRKDVGRALGEYRKNLSKTRDIDTNQAFRNFHEYLKENYGVKFDKDGKIIADSGTLATSDIPQIQKLYDQLRSDKLNSQVELDQWLQRSYKDYDLVQKREQTFSEEVSRIAEYARGEVGKLMPEDYNLLRQEYAAYSKPLNDFVKLLGYKGSLDDLTTKDLKTGEVALRVLGNAADRPQSVIDEVLSVAGQAGYESNIDLNRLIYITDQLEDLYDITPTRGFSGSATRGINQSGVGATLDAATLNFGSLFDRAMTSKASQKEIQQSFETYLKYLDEGGDPENFKPAQSVDTTKDAATNNDIILREVPDRDQSLTGRGAEIQEASIAKYEADPEGMVNEYLDTNGKVINTDEARKLFADVGYNGANSAAVHEAASAVSKSAWRKALAENPGDRAIILAGGSGTGKTSVATKVLGEMSEKASAFLDGNLSKISSALERIKEAKDAGKDVILTYVYRDPEDAWVNGVISRMLNNPDEGGRVVPLSTFLENHNGSLKVVKDLLNNKDINKINLIDNSFGKDAHKLIELDKLNNLSYDIDKLRSSLLAVTKKLYEQGKITDIQYKSLIK